MGTRDSQFQEIFYPFLFNNKDHCYVDSLIPCIKHLLLGDCFKFTLINCAWQSEKYERIIEQNTTCNIPKANVCCLES